MAANTNGSVAGVAAGVAAVVAGEGIAPFDVLGGPARSLPEIRKVGGGGETVVQGVEQEVAAVDRLRGPAQVGPVDLAVAGRRGRQLPVLQDPGKFDIDAEGEGSKSVKAPGGEGVAVGKADAVVVAPAGHMAPGGEGAAVGKGNAVDAAPDGRMAPGGKGDAVDAVPAGHMNPCGEGVAMGKGEAVDAAPAGHMVIASELSDTCTRPVPPIRWLGKGNMNRGTTPKRPSTPEEDDEIKQQVLRDSGRVHEQEFLTYRAVPEAMTRNRAPHVVELLETFFAKMHASSVTRRKILFMDLAGLRGTKAYFAALKSLSEQRDEVDADVERINKQVKKVLVKAPAYFLPDPELLPK